MGYMYSSHLEMIWAVVAVLANNKLWNHTYYHWIV